MYYLTKEWHYSEQVFLKECQQAGLKLEKLQIGQNVIDQAFKKAYPKGRLQMTDLELPDFWEITVHFEIYDGERLKGQIMPISPTGQVVEYIQWLTDEGQLFSRDFYDGLKSRYKQEIWLKEKEGLVQTNYFDPDGQERLQVFHEQDRALYLREDGQDQGFASLQDAEDYFLERLLDQEDCFLLSDYDLFRHLKPQWQKKVVFYLESDLENEDLQHLMLAAKKVVTRNRGVLENDQKETEPVYLPYLQGEAHPFRPHCLIMTNTQDLEQIERLVTSLPDWHFHIGALTDMGPALTDLDRFKNVHLYPNIQAYRYDALLQFCCVYLDIAYANEVLEANRLALAHGLLLYSFRETCHRPEFYPAEHLFEAEKVDQLIACLQGLEGPEAYQSAQERMAKVAILGSASEFQDILLDKLS